MAGDVPGCQEIRGAARSPTNKGGLDLVLPPRRSLRNDAAHDRRLGVRALGLPFEAARVKRTG